MRKFRFPNTYVIISAIILICAVATWFVPGGQYVTGPDGAPSFGSVDSVPQTWQVFSALYEGFVKQAGIIVFILVVGGSFWLLNSTGAVEYGIRKFIGRVGRYDKLVLASIAVLFSLGGAVFGMSEETIPFVGIVVPLVVSMGYDAIVGLLVVYVASNIGFSSAFLNPFTVGIAQEMSGLPMFSGMGYRLVCWAVLTAALVVFTLVYASGVRKQPAAVQSRAGCDGTPTVRKRIVLGILLLTVIALVVGVVRFKWYMPEISALFLAMGVFCGVAGGLRPGRIADEFMAGAKDIFPAAMVVGLASGIVVILQDGKILDTLLHSLELSVGDSSPLASLSAMYGLQALVNLVIPSATAKAAITIPIMAPFADMIGLSRQATVLAFQFGDGFTNMITPTSGVLIAALAMAKVPYSEWVRRAWKPVLILLAAGFLLLVPTVLATIPEF
mgnify:CR=1 FL=1